MAALLLSTVLTSCHLRTYEYTDTEHRVTISYPGRVNLLRDPKVLDQAFAPAIADEGGSSSLSFAVQTERLSTGTCAIQSVPGKAEFTPETYFEATTARELEMLGADILEPRAAVTINGKPFQQVGFELKDEDGQSARCRIYQYYDPSTRKVLVFALTAKPEDWKEDLPSLEAMAQSLKVDW